MTHGECIIRVKLEKSTLQIKKDTSQSSTVKTWTVLYTQCRGRYDVLDLISW